MDAGRRFEIHYVPASRYNLNTLPHDRHSECDDPASVTETIPNRSGPPIGETPPSPPWLRYSSYAALLLTIAFFAWIRFHLRSVPLERDEGEYAYMGQLILQGVPPYKLASNMKLPGTYAAYALLMAIFGQTTEGIRTAMILMNAAATLLVFLLTKYLYGRLAATVAGVSYAFLSIRPALLALDGHATHFVVVAALAGIVLLLHAIDRNDNRDNNNRSQAWLFLASGLCFGLAFLMKQPGILFGIFAGLYWLSREWGKNAPRRNLAIGGALAAGAALPFVLTCLLLFRAGVFHNFWFWTWSYAREYASLATWPVGWHLLSVAAPWVVRPFAICEIVLFGLTAPLWSRYARAHAGFVTSFFFFSWLAVCPGFYFRQHYFILVLPAAAMCTGIGVEAARQFLLKRLNPQPRRFALLIASLPMFYFAVVFIVSVRSQYQEFFRLDPLALSRKMHPNQPYAEAVLASAYIKAHSSPQDQVGLMGSEPEICFDTRLHCATSYIYMYPLLEQQKFAPQMRSDMMQQMEHSHPRFLVYVDAELSWWGQMHGPRENIDFFDWAWNYAHNGYELVDQIPVVGNGKHLQGDQAMIYIFSRP